MEKYYKIDRRIHEIAYVLADSEEEAKEKLQEEDFEISEIRDDVMRVIGVYDEITEY